MTPEELAAELAGGRIRPAYLVAGPEPLLRDEALAAIRRAVVGESPSEFDVDRLEGERATPAALREALAMLPMMAPRRLVWLREPAARRGRRPILDALPEIVKGLAEDTPAVLVVSASAADGRAAWTRAFADPAAFVRCDPPRGARALVSFVRAEAKRQGLALGPGAAERLAERVGPQLLVIRQELAKAALLAGPDGRVDEATIALAVADLAEEPVWELTDAIGEGRAGDALAILAKLEGSGVAEPLVLGTLASHFRKLVRVRAGARVAGPPFVVRKLEAQARRYPQARLRRCLAAIHETDAALKGQGALRPRLALERLVLNLSV